VETSNIVESAAVHEKLGENLRSNGQRSRSLGTKM